MPARSALPCYSRPGHKPGAPLDCGAAGAATKGESSLLAKSKRKKRASSTFSCPKEEYLGLNHTGGLKFRTCLVKMGLSQALCENSSWKHLISNSPS